MRLSELGELGLLKKIRTLCRKRSRGVILSIGDDAAAVKTSKKTTLLASDMLLEGVHFDLSFTSFYQLGYKILAVNLSDIFAMGGRALYFLLNIGLPRTCDSQDVRELYSGIMKMASKYGVSVIGGDTCTSKKGLVLSGTLIGETDRVLTRSGARPGDGIFVTGTLGDSAAGLMLLRRGKKKLTVKKRDKGPRTTNSHLKLIRAHLMPEPVPVKKRSGISSMIDISDGLVTDLSHICEESGVGGPGEMLSV
jgi:thiamine-monophosphate kinase